MAGGAFEGAAGCSVPVGAAFGGGCALGNRFSPDLCPTVQWMVALFPCTGGFGSACPPPSADPSPPTLLQPYQPVPFRLTFLMAALISGNLAGLGRTMTGPHIRQMSSWSSAVNTTTPMP